MVVIVRSPRRRGPYAGYRRVACALIKLKRKMSAPIKHDFTQQGVSAQQAALESIQLRNGNCRQTT